MLKEWQKVTSRNARYFHCNESSFSKQQVQFSYVRFCGKVIDDPNGLSSLWEERMNLRHEIVLCRNLKDLPVFRLFPYSCQYCVYWESTEDSDEKVSKEKAQQLKSDWFRNVSKEFGDCGVIAYLNNESVGYAQYALPKFFPRVQQYASGPPSDDSVFLACLYIPKRELRGMGIGRYLLDFVLSNLQKRGYGAIETYARKGSESNPAGPLGFYLKNGFFVKRERDEFPLVRKEFGTVML